MTDIHTTDDTIDELIASRLPRWLVDHHQQDRLHALRLALRRQEEQTRRLDLVFSHIPPLRAFAEQCLQTELERIGHGHIDVARSWVCITRRAILPSGSPVLYMPTHLRRSKQTLLSAALHNFKIGETRPSINRSGELVDRKGKRLLLSFTAFAAVCRRIDVGGRYQALLNAQLSPEDDAGQAHLNALIDANLRTNMEVAVRIAAMKGEIDEHAYLSVLPMLATQAVVPSVRTRVIARQPYLLGRCMRGILTVELHPTPDQPLTSVMLWIPGDPSAAVTCHAGWDALYGFLGRRLLDPAYRRFFTRFVSERDRNDFHRLLAERVKEASAQGAELDGRHVAVDKPAFEHMRDLYLAKIFDDAKVLAVSTEDEDEQERYARLQGYIELGFNLASLAGLFVPVLGEVMMVTNGVQIASEVYEGYQDWRIGDREGAMNHLFDVAENLVVGALIAKGSQLAVQSLRRVAFVDELVPVRATGGKIRLQAADLHGYQAEPRDVGGAHEWLWHVEETRYRVVDAPEDGTSRVEHPRRPEAYRPRVQGNGSGGWRHELESPQHWNGAGNLVRRLGAQLADLPDATCEYLLQVIGSGEDQIRRLHVENVGAPARLLDALEMYQAHELYPDLDAAGLARHVASRQIRPNATERLLRRSFAGLSMRCTRELLSQCSGEQLDMLTEKLRIPLVVAERARWSSRQSRLDRACAGLRLDRWVNADTERLALGLLEREVAWPSTTRVELREGTAGGRLLASIGTQSSEDVRCIVRLEDGYRHVQQTTPGSYLRALLAALDDEQKDGLGDAALSPRALGERLAEVACQNRPQAARMCGMATQGVGLRPPLRLGDGRLGYPLSGRGPSGGRALARAIHQIFPTLDDYGLDAYLADLRSRGVGVWEHFTALQEQLADLRRTLRDWRSDSSNPLDSMRRRRVATALRRSWRRKLTDVNGDYILVIEGERIGRLPELPQAIRFDHVQRLVLRDLHLTEVTGAFLERFPNLVELDLSDNQLTTIPSGLAQMSRLRELNFQGNRIVMDDVAERRLIELRSLQWLDLGNNPLGRAPILTSLNYLRHVSLNATALQELPGRVSLRAHVDLRNNRIAQLRRDVQQLRLQVQRFSLHDNPLDEADEALLDEARGVASGARGSASARHYPVDDRLFEDWAGVPVGSDHQRRRAIWNSLRDEPQSTGLFRFLADFARTDDFSRHSGHYRGRIWRVLEACEQHEQVRQQLFLEASGPRTCEDRLLLILEQLEIGVQVERAVEDAAGSEVELRLLRLARSLFRLDEVDRLATLHIQQMHSRPSAQVDEVEVRLFYRLQLARALALPVEVDDMHYPTEANVTVSDLLQAQDQVLQAETAEALIASLAQRPFWARFARSYYNERFEEVLQPLHRRMEGLQAQADEGVIDDWAFVQRCEGITQDFNRTERGLIERLAQEAYERWSKPG
ncbi:NEL-type E3 ubiquitin ligase domain-containing protein [Pseudomonas sp. NPDC089996]|uniref:NEL-type E3 ubiquitin ligase domain-containing protein n=1 Tax=Pseudomonas sp. NPDC089996 TaxID=3364474 RepID=UPI0038004D61